MIFCDKKYEFQDIENRFSAKNGRVRSPLNPMVYSVRKIEIKVEPEESFTKTLNSDDALNTSVELNICSQFIPHLKLSKKRTKNNFITSKGQRRPTAKYQF